ncbi:putative myosin-1 isoform X1 [Iris pallida]|uniref:Myosin-1 isoform X1 n=1 Tax=Iris pallida TaxID=29817 RepID=A0AAX6IA05_IRIPA|nr:putative myosin-1 isoform X1 [Iris pallida]
MTPASAVRSSLEEMLDSLRRRDERPKDEPPALPPRPTSRGRLPSQRRSLPVDFKVGAKEGEGRAVDGDEEVVLTSRFFGNKRIARMPQPEDSPYVKMPKLEKYKDEPLDEKFRWVGAAAGGSVPKKKKLRVWCRLPNTDWELGNIHSIKGEDTVVLLSNGNVLRVSTKNLLPVNPDILDDVDDLIKLSYLNEPSVLRTVKCRYSRDMVYTKAGNVLVAINPFKEVPLYGSDLAAAYREKKDNRPHVYAIADSAYNAMMRDGANQSIIISGESGAGKTETAKITMQYLVTLGGRSGIENKVIQTNFILEAFGNAKTSRNDNSSRFGKLTEMQFNDGGKFCGARIQTFLLEKTRVVQRETGERSYHVFYQLCAGASHILKEKLNLKAADEYEYLKQSDCLRISCVDDAQRFHMLMEALNIAHISKEDQENAFTMLAAVLWLGNIEFQVIDAENHVEVVSSEGVTSAAKLMGCEVSELMLALSTRKFHAGKDSIIEKLTLSQAIDTRNALAMSVYVFLFDWLIQKINKSLEVGERQTCRSITILDIYGFESFHRNGFEQICINYANERLQQHFNRHMFKLEQEEYVQDGIDWTTVEFIDNSECLDLFEKRPLGLLSLLDEESSFPEATDLTFINKLKQHLDGNPCFKGEGRGAFRVRHYAGEVLYDTSGFLEKNRDLLHSDYVKLLAHCQLSGLFASYILDRSQDTNLIRQFTSADLLDRSVGSKFKGQLFKLMQCLESTTPHFIRCIKPNNNQLPGMFENEHVLQQLRCCGVLEIVKISKAGYPFRIAHQRFAERYGFLIFENVASEDPLSIAVAVLQKFNVLPEMYQVGYTQLFFSHSTDFCIGEHQKSHYTRDSSHSEILSWS